MAGDTELADFPLQPPPTHLTLGIYFLLMGDILLQLAFFFSFFLMVGGWKGVGGCFGV